jgi:mannose-1-phosphate guanylyltransferase/mannose-6-phosphate isomerase
MARIFQAIMCGGEGKRLWPLSRRSYPKYYVELEDGESLFQEAFRRALRTSAIEDILLITTEVNKHNALKQARAIIPSFPDDGLVIRPEGKETFITMAAALATMTSRGAAPSDVLVCSPADHVIADVSAYSEIMKAAAEVAHDHYVVIGIPPTEPSSDFGYIECSKDDPQIVKRFTEKPDRETAEGFLAQGNYLWNAGFHIGSLETFLREIRMNEPEAHDIIVGGMESIIQNFDALPGKSIDYVVAEKASSMRVVRATFDWDDLGDLESFIPARGKEQRIAAFDSSNVTACVDGKLVVAVGVSDLTIVDGQDTLLIMHKNATGKLSKVVDALREQGHPEADHHFRGYRPWGIYEILEEGPGFKVKKITVTPGAASSLQTHSKRAEHWVVVSGIAKVTLGAESRLLHPNESLYIPIGEKHRIENPSTTPLILIEVQTGGYLGEDDIVRHEDNFGRV